MSYHYEQNNDVVVFPDERNFLLARVAYLEYQASHPSVGFVDFIRNRLYVEGAFQIESAHGQSAAPAAPIAPLSSLNAETLFNTSFDPATPYTDTTTCTILNAINVPFINIPPPADKNTTDILSTPFNASREADNPRTIWSSTNWSTEMSSWGSVVNMFARASPVDLPFQPPPPSPPPPLSAGEPLREAKENNDEGFDNPFELLDMEGE